MTRPEPENSSPTPATMSATRSSTLSWNRRPMSKDIDTTNIDVRSETALVEGQSDTPSRDRIAQSLGSKDPSWFRQTSDRGIGSPAYRRTQEDSTTSDVTSIGGNTRLPGLRRDSTTESQRPHTPGSDFHIGRSRSPSKASSTYNTNSSLGNRYSSVSSVSTAGLGLGSPSPITGSQRFHSRAPSTASDNQPTDQVTMSPNSQNRLGNDRPSSPTKGLGGFVQSAMMKRSDSVSKRWSAQSGTGIGRPNIAPPGRNELGNTPRFGHKNSISFSREGSDATSTFLSNSRPGSSHSEATVVKSSSENEQGDSSRPTTSGSASLSNDGFVKPSLPSQTSSKWESSAAAAVATTKSPSIPTSPSKTMDAKRWSPTKATWLESALNKPDSPRTKPQVPQEPEWKKDINRLRQSKRSVDLGTTKFPKLPEDKPIPRPTDTSPTRTSKSGQTSPTETQSETAAVNFQNPPNDKPQAPLKHARSDSLKNIPSPVSDDSPNITPKPSFDYSQQKDQSSVTSPLPTKSSAEHNPATDLRNGLRRREAAPEVSAKDAPEFMNVFGKLRKAETKNYVAPDKFKDNILKGKAALNQTGGPKKTPKVDEFKESLVKQKEAMKVGGGSVRRNTNDTKENSPDKSAAPVPEAIAKRGNLARSGSIQGGGPGIDTSTLVPQKTGGNFPLRTRRSDSIQSPVQGTSGMESPSSLSPSPHKLVDKHADKDNTTSGAVSPVLNSQEPTKEKGQERPVEDEVSGTNVKHNVGVNSDVNTPKTPLLNERAGKGLAGRLNPALAGILSRGPPPPAGGSSGGTTGGGSSSPTRSSPSETPATLTHMTKSRAKGPKRRLPQTAANAKTSPSKIDDEKPKHQSTVAERQPLHEISFGANTNPSEASPRSTETRSFAPKQNKSYNTSSFANTPDAGDKSSTSKPPISAKSPQLRKISSTSLKKEHNGTSSATPTSPGQYFPPSRHAGSPVTESPPEPEISKSTSRDEPRPDQKPNVPQESVSLPSSVPSVKPQNTDSPRLPRKLQEFSTTNPNANSTVVDARPAEEFKENDARRISSATRKPSSPSRRVVSPSVPPKPSSVSAIKPNERSSIQTISPFPEASDAFRLFSEFFDKPPSAGDKVDVDPQSVLMSGSGAYPKVKTISKQIWELKGDGKKQDLPTNQEYVLFEESMYLCVHSFETSNNGKNTEVQLWSGDGVSEAALEDAQLFARKVARDHSCKLELLKQGKETTNFIQALGGIIITRRGSSNRSHSSLYMLCGRRHMGQIAFDEVDLSIHRLCSGYPYIISAKFGKLYLWQGRGSAADELGCARLIGMDLGLTGEIEEVVEGQEPPGFFDAFPDQSYQQQHPRVYHDADHWKLKPSNEQYRCRLYRIDHDSGGQKFGSTGFWSRRGASSPVNRSKNVVQEIEPFNQRDVDPTRIFVLDAFFEIFV